MYLSAILPYFEYVFCGQSRTPVPTISDNIHFRSLVQIRQTLLTWHKKASPCQGAGVLRTPLQSRSTDRGGSRDRGTACGGKVVILSLSHFDKMTAPSSEGAAGFYLKYLPKSPSKALSCRASPQKTFILSGFFETLHTLLHILLIFCMRI